jgi:hypothetical protein
MGAFLAVLVLRRPRAELGAAGFAAAVREASLRLAPIRERGAALDRGAASFSVIVGRFPVRLVARPSAASQRSRDQ